jgi:hypothetical protein
MKQLLQLLALLAAFSAVAAEEKFVPLFNGRNLDGWTNVNCAPETWSVVDGMIHCTGFPTGALRTTRQYENFILELEWRHLSRGGNAGIFIWATPLAAPGVPFLRCIEVQVLDHGYDAKGKNEWYTTHGDVFPIHGATMKPFGRSNGERSFPSEERSKGSPEWNHYRIVCTNGVLRLHVNGREVSGGENCNYRQGYIGIESEGAPAEYRNIRIQELPPSGAPPEMTAPLDQNWRSLFTGLDWRGWKTNAAVLERWSIEGERLRLREGAATTAATLRSEKEFGDAEFIVDCRPAKSEKGSEVPPPSVELRGLKIDLTDAEAGKYQRYVVTVRGRTLRWGRGGESQKELPLPADAPARGSFGLRDTGHAMELMNFYERDL